MKVSKSRLLATAIVLMTFVSLFSVISPAEQAYVHEDEYAYLEGVLDTDSYALYPYNTTKSLDIGFSKYGEMVNPDEPVGLRYGSVDPFANENVSEWEWSEGWVMNLTYKYQREERTVWAYALYTDFAEYGGEWINNASSPTSAPHGGRKTSGYATTEPMEVIYDGPRSCIVKLKTTIFDPRVTYPPEPVKGIPLVDLVIQVVFNKVKKYVLLIKDIKLRTESKLLGKVQVKFSQRGEWDLGWTPEWGPHSYAHFYHALPTKYFKHPWYMADWKYTGYDLLQVIDTEENYVAYAAYWPELMSYRVEDIIDMYVEEKLGDLSDWEQSWIGEEGYDNIDFVASVPGYYQNISDWPDQGLYYPDCDFPPDWSYAEPEVYVDDVKKTYGTHYNYSFTPGSPGGHGVEEIPGTFWLNFTTSQPDAADIYVHWKLHAEQNDMTEEAATPYSVGEWVFDLNYLDEDLPTHQFRCSTVYGVTDLNDGEDDDMGGDAENIIDSEVLFQLDEVFNPWDLRQAVGQESWADYGWIYDMDWGYEPDPYHVRDWWSGKNTERWVEFYTGDGEEDEFWLPQQIVVPDEPWLFPDWDQYCSIREKVLVDGVLQVPGEDEDYELEWTWYIEESVAEGALDIEDGDSFDLMYPRIESVYDVWEADEDGDWYDYVYYWDVDYSNGKLYIWDDIELDEDHTIEVGYYLYFPAAYIDFYDESVPEEDAEIKILYSTFRIVYKTDKFLYGIDGLLIEDSDEYMYGVPEEFDMYWLRYGPVVPEYFIEYTVGYAYPNWVTVLVDGYELSRSYWYLDEYYGLPYIWVDPMEMGYGDVIEVIYPIFAGRYEWTTVGTKSAAVDSAGASMVSEGFRQWKNFDTKIASLDFQDDLFGPNIPYLFCNVSGTGEDRDRSDYYDDQEAQTVEEDAGRAHLRDDWCTTLPISSSNIIVVGGPYANLAAEYFNDFTDVYVPRIGSDFGDGFYSHACWGRNLYEVEYDEGEQTTGYAIISTYKDLNGTIGFIVYGWTGDDTYYATYALQHGLLEIMQWLQPGVTSLVLEFDYTVHPSEEGFFSIVESLGTFTECGGFDWVLDWEFYGMDFYDDELTFKLVMNSYSSEYWVFHIHMDFDVEKDWHLPDVVAIEVTYPQYIYFNWEPKIHPDP